jgi:hypothetical protein
MCFLIAAGDKDDGAARRPTKIHGEQGQMLWIYERSR